MSAVLKPKDDGSWWARHRATWDLYERAAVNVRGALAPVTSENLDRALRRLLADRVSVANWPIWNFSGALLPLPPSSSASSRARQERLQEFCQS